MDERKDGAQGLSSFTAGIPTLKSDNFMSWSEMIKMSLKLRKLHKALVDESVDEDIDLMACMLLKGTMDETHLGIVRGAQTAKEIMTRLETAYADRSAANKFRLIQKFYRYSKLPTDTMTVHIGRMDEMRNKLRDLGEDQSEAVYQAALIGSLPKEYSSIMENWELTHESMRTTQNLVARLIKRENDNKEDAQVDGPNAFVGRVNRSVKTSMTQEEVADLKKRTKCGRCKEKGHWWRECPNGPSVRNQPQVSKPQGSNLVRADVMFNATDQDMNLKNVWIIDSGASSHMSNNDSWFSSLTLFDAPKSCAVGDGRALKVLGIGEVSLQFRIGQSLVLGKLKDVLYIPDLAANLVSVGAAAKSGVETNFAKEECKLTKNGQIVAEGLRLKDNLYLLEAKPERDCKALIATSPKRTMLDYHRSLGHASARRIKVLLRSLGIRLPTDEGFDCPDCPVGKGLRARHPGVGLRASELGTVHADLSGIVNKASLEGYQYYLLCKDAYSEFVMGYCIQKKSDVPTTLKRFLIDFENLSGHQVREFHSDNGTEFVNNVTNVLWLREGIKHWLSAPYCPEQNGRIEREMRTITESASTMLNASGLPKTLWPYAIGFAIYVKNRLPTTASDTTPFERFVGRRPTIDHMVEFGQSVHVLNNGSYLTKWDSRTTPGFIIGYTQRRNTYKVYIPDKTKVVETCDIIFAKHRSGALTSEATIQEPGVQSIGISIPERRTLVPTQIHSTMTDNQPEGDNTSQPFPLDTDQEGPYSTDGDNQTPTNSTPREMESDPNVPNQRRLCTGPELSRFFEEYRTRDAEENRCEIDESCDLGSIERQLSGCREMGIVEERLNECPLARPLRMASWRGEEALNETDHDRSGTTALTDQSRSRANYSSARVFIADLLEPRTYQEAVSGPNCREWCKSIELELAAHRENNTWTVVDRPSTGVSLTTRWVFALKRNNEGSIERYKSRLVARGFEQREGRDYGETYAPVARTDSFRTILALAAANMWAYSQFDVSTAFLNGDIDTEIHIEPPEGMTVDTSKCLKLNKALYGLKQSPRCWNSKFNQVANDMGFVQTKTDTCVFQRQSTIMLLYVDDGLVFDPDQETCEQVIRDLSKHFKLKRMSGQCFIGIQIKKTDDMITICQQRYVRDIISRFKMENALGVSSPILETDSLHNQVAEVDNIFPYRELLGCLQYLASSTRPDIAFAVNFLARFCQKPTKAHCSALKRVVRYLISTPNYAIEYKMGNRTMAAYSDADWANDRDDRRSVTGLIITLAGGPIIYASRKQPVVAQSSTEAEFIAANEAVKEIVWLNRLLDELGIKPDPIILAIDNQPAISQVTSLDVKRRSKHVDIRYHFIREKFQAGAFQIKHISSQDQPADVLTKPIAGSRMLTILETIQVRIPVMNNQQANSVGSRLTKTVLITGCFLALCGCSRGEWFTATDEIALLESDVRVDLGLQVVMLGMHHVTPCKNLEETIKNEIVQTGETQIKAICEDHYEKVVQPAYRELHTCLPEELKQKHRKKREAFTIFALGTLIISAIVTGVGTLIAWFTAKADREELRRKNEEQDRQLEALRQRLVNSLGSQESLIKGYNVTLEQAEKNRLGIEHLSQYVPNLAWQASTLTVQLDRERVNVLKVAKACQRGRVDLEALQQLVPQPQLLTINDEVPVYMDHVKAVSPGLINLQFHYQEQSKDTKVFEVVAFKHFKDIASQTSLMEYRGPQFVVVNATNNCIKGINDPGRQRAIYTQCTEEGFSDPNLKNWAAVDRYEVAQLTPQIYKTTDMSLISCFGHEITIRNRTRPCPHYPFKLGLDVPFSLRNYTHDVKIMQLKSHGQVIRPQRFRLYNTTDDAYDRGSRYLYEAVLKNEAGFKSPSIGISFDQVSNLNATNWIMLIGSLIAVGTLLFKIMRCVLNKTRRSSRRSQSHDGTREEHTERINIINQISRDGPEPGQDVHHVAPARYAYPILPEPGESIVGSPETTCTGRCTEPDRVLEDRALYEMMAPSHRHPHTRRHLQAPMYNVIQGSQPEIMGRCWDNNPRL